MIEARWCAFSFVRQKGGRLVVGIDGPKSPPRSQCGGIQEDRNRFKAQSAGYHPLAHP